MANVDFTLEDIRNVVREEIDTRVPGIFANEFEKIWDGNLEPALNRLEGEMKSIKRVVNQHSAEIMELKAKLA